MLSACMEYEDILSDKQRGAHPSPFPSKARLPVAFPKGREPDTHPQPLPKGGGKGQAPTRSGGYVIRLNKREPCIRGALSPSLGEGRGGSPPPSSLEVAPQAIAD